MDIQSISIEANSLLVIHAASGSHVANIASDASAIVRATGAAALLILRPEESIESLDDLALRRIGLCRIDAPAKSAPVFAVADSDETQAQ